MEFVLRWSRPCARPSLSRGDALVGASVSTVDLVGAHASLYGDIPSQRRRVGAAGTAELEMEL